MKIAILGTRGIPNQYGGFEQFAEILSEWLVEKGHDVTVYNPHFHDYNRKSLNGVKIISIYSPEKRLGAFANFIYDFLCLHNATKKNFDIYLELGYATVSVFYPFFKRLKGKLITNMDGLEWKRDKWSPQVKKLTRNLEKIGVKYSDRVVADNPGIKDYLDKKYRINSKYIAYPADIELEFNSELIKSYNLKANSYLLLIARLEKENNIELILDGYSSTAQKIPFLVVGNNLTIYGQQLSKKYADSNIIFAGAIYEKDTVNSIRHFSLLYFHGHSVGGTNPSLLEAMGCSSFIAAHSNIFNRSVLGEDHSYFIDSSDVKGIIEDLDNELIKKNTLIKRNKKLISSSYNSDLICSQYESLFKELIDEKH